MTQVGENEWVTYLEGRPGETRKGDINLGSAQHGDAVGDSLEFTFGETDSEHIATIDRWEGSIQAIPAGDGPVQAKFNVSVPSTTSATDSLTLVVDGRRVPMAPQVINPWMYEANVQLPASGLYAYHVERDSNSRGPARTLDANLAEQNVNGWVVAWSDESQEPLDPDFIAGYYTLDFWSPSMLGPTPATYRRISEHNGSLVAVSSVWSYGRTQPLPNVEPRPVESACVCLPYLEVAPQADFAKQSGLDVFFAPQFNMEMSRGGMDGLCCESQTDEWWDAWRDSAERFWLWNAKVASETGAEMLLLPGFVFHVFPQSGLFESDDSYRAFDRSMIDLVDRVREIYDGKVLISGGLLDTELPGHADLIGVTTFDTGRPNLPPTATVDEWKAGYEKHLQNVADPIWERWGKPVFFYTINPSSSFTDAGGTFENAQAAEL
jgi:hypothetical protein